jgi:hypothetical protein
MSTVSVRGALLHTFSSRVMSSTWPSLSVHKNGHPKIRPRCPTHYEIDPRITRSFPVLFPPCLAALLPAMSALHSTPIVISPHNGPSSLPITHSFKDAYGAAMPSRPSMVGAHRGRDESCLQLPAVVSTHQWRCSRVSLTLPKPASLWIVCRPGSPSATSPQNSINSKLTLPTTCHMGLINMSSSPSGVSASVGVSTFAGQTRVAWPSTSSTAFSFCRACNSLWRATLTQLSPSRMRMGKLKFLLVALPPR